MSSNVTLNFEKEKNGKSYKMYIKGKPKKISGHRFTYLTHVSKLLSFNQLVLDLYGLKYVKPTIRLALGNKLEPYLVEYLYQGKYYLTFDYQEEKGNAFDDGSKMLINGLPDAIIPKDNELCECKVTTSLFNGYKEYWKKQAQFYAYNWNKYKKDEMGFEIKKITILKYYVPEHLMEWQVNHPDEIIPEHVFTYDIPLDTEKIEKELNYAINRRESIIKKPYVKFSLNRSMFLRDGLLDGMVNQKRRITFKYDKEDKELDEWVNQIKNKAKYLRRKKKQYYY